MLALSLMSAAADAHAGDWSSAPYEYRSDDPTPIRVELSRAGRSLVLHVPRSAIVFVADYDARETPELPKSIEVHRTFQLGLVAPHATPIGEVDEYSMSAADFRRARTMFEVRLTKPDLTAAKMGELLLHPPQGYEVAEAAPFEGLKASEVVRYEKAVDGSADRTRRTFYSDEVFFLGSPDEFFDYIRCARSNTHPVVFCDYFVRVSDWAYLKAAFVDFRYNGGRAFATQRMKMILATYCDYSRDRESALCMKASGAVHDAD
jgi:hypothetical protein